MSNVAIAPPFGSTESYFFLSGPVAYSDSASYEQTHALSRFKSRIPVSQASYVIGETAFNGVLPA
jgi:hypothetical protein